MKTSEEDLETEVNDSVFDFLYTDHERLALFLSQFHDFGHLTGIAHGKNAQRGKGDKGQLEAGGNALVVKGKAKYEGSTSASYSENRQDTFDPKWVNTLQFLDEIQHRGILKRDIEQANLGDVVMLSGNITIRDLGLLERAWQLPTVKHFSKLGEKSATPNRSERRAGKTKVGAKSDPTEVDLFFDLVQTLPHPAQITIQGDVKAWGVLKEDALVSSPSDFALKYGGNIPGEWAVIGVLDADPDSDIPDGQVTQTQNLMDVSDALLGVLEPLVRQLLGRPIGSYGITPLIVFREVG